jgi:hypothetical protein
VRGGGSPDTAASGEGAPDVPHASQHNPAQWLGWSSSDTFYSTPQTCHRSNKSGPARAYFNHIKPSFPNSTFVSVACSGAAIYNGLLQPQLHDDGTTKVAKSQLDQVKKWMSDNRPGRRIDALFISVGVNDIGFGNIVERCIDIYYQPCQNNSNFTIQVEQRLAALNGYYNHLANNIQFHLNPVKVYITEYPDPTRKTPTTFCDGEPSFPELLGLIEKSEAQWASEFVIATLNAKVQAAAQNNVHHGWQFVGGVASAFRGHGWCASSPFVNTAGASNSVQGDIWGMVHPNATGYQTTGDRIATTFNSTFPSLSPTRVSLSTSAYNIVQLNWGDHSASETRYEVQTTASLNGAPLWTLTTTLAANTATWTHGPLEGASGYSYAYQVRACNSGGCAPWSNQVTYTVPPPPNTIPAAPGNLKDTVTIIGEQEKHTLSWTLNSTNQTQIVLKYREVGATTWTAVTMPTATTKQYVLGPAFNVGHSYNFYVQACNTYGCSAPSNTITVEIY